MRGRSLTHVLTHVHTCTHARTLFFNYWNGGTKTAVEMAAGGCVIPSPSALNADGMTVQSARISLLDVPLSQVYPTDCNKSV